MNDKYKATIKVFDRKTNILVDEDTFYYGDLIKKYSPKKYIYALSVFENENFNERVYDKHFDVGVFLLVLCVFRSTNVPTDTSTEMFIKAFGLDLLLQ